MPVSQKFQIRNSIYDAIFQQAPIGIAILFGDNTVVGDVNEAADINPTFQQITGRTKEELLKLGWAKITHPDDLAEDLYYYKRLQAGEINSYSMEKRYLKPDGSVVWVHMVVAKLSLSSQHKLNHICLVQDISKRKETEEALAESERSKSVLLSHLPGMAYRCNYDHKWTMQYVSAGCFELTGYTAENLLNNRDLSFNDLIAPEYHILLWKEWERVLAQGLPFKYEYQIITARGERKWVLEMGQGVYNEQGEVEALEGIILDISDRKEIENNLRYNNEHDIWTGLYNRRYLENLLLIDAQNQTNKKRAIIGINLSTVLLLSMTYGIQYSQELINKVAEALKYYCTENRQLFSTAENRFTLYIKDYLDKKELKALCEDIANTLEPLLVMERIGAGIGVVEINEDNKNNIEQLLKNLLIASEKAINAADKDIGCCFFDTAMEAQLVLEEEIKRELTLIAEEENNDNLFLQFQPLLDLKTNQICSFEALARLKSDRLGLVMPMEFIPIAEKTKLIIPLGRKIFLQALQFLNTLKKNGYDTISVSVNISAIQLLRKGFVNNLFDMINAMQVNPTNIVLEITESTFATNYQDINSILCEIKEYGLNIAIDDFGTGYSSLARERELNVSCIKIDKYFIDKLLSLKPEEAITGDIISMAHKLGHYVIAEGVEHQKQKEYLHAFGCDRIQGYLISKPLNKKKAFEFLNSWV